MLKGIIDKYYGDVVGCVVEDDKLHSINKIDQREVKNDNRLSVVGYCNGYEATLQFDTGADVCVATANFVSSKEIDVKDRKSLKNADGSPLEVLGAAEVNLQLKDGTKFREKMQIIASNRQKVLLSLSFMRFHGLKNLLPADVLNKLIIGEKNYQEEPVPDYSRWPGDKRDLFKEQLIEEGYEAEVNLIESLGKESYEEEFSILQFPAAR